MIGVLHIVRLFIGLSIEVDDVIFDLQRLSWQTHTALHVVLATVCRTRVDDTIFLLVLLDSLLTSLIDSIEVAR